MPKLTEPPVYPKLIKKQSVATWLKLFCEETYNAINNHLGMRNVGRREHTVAFIKFVVKWWKILNVKNIDVDLRFNIILQVVVQNPLDERVHTFLMKGGQGKRYKQFNRDTALAIHHAWNAIVTLCRSQLQVSHNYALLRTFSTDPLEKEFGKLRQESGETYFITMQQIIKEVSISKASLLKSTNINVDSFNIDSSHSSFNYCFLLDKNSVEIFDSLPELESSGPKDTKMVLVLHHAWWFRMIWGEAFKWSNLLPPKVWKISRCYG